VKARDVMTSDVVSVRPDTPVGKIACLLIERGIGATPVVDDAGAPIGMVSDGDLIGRDDAEREARRDWWLALLAEGESVSPDFLASLRSIERTAREVMSRPVVTVGINTDVTEIARLLTSYRIKRVPVVREGRMVGIVSRADLLRALSAERSTPTAQSPRGLLAGALAGLDERFIHRTQQEEPVSAMPRDHPIDASMTSTQFQKLAADFELTQARHRDALRKTVVERRRRQVAELIDHHISDESWRELVHRARKAAEQGQKEYMLLRFPCQLCSDKGRAINVTETNWSSTLRGEAAELYLRWEKDLKPHGFHLTARVLDFPGGIPGDIGLFLTWGG
jgi:CBS domain-containing protein